MIKNYLVRLANWIVTKSVYRIKVYGKENLPKSGGALFVANHISFVDANIIQAALNQPLRFLMDYYLYRLPLIKQIVAASGAIPIAGRHKPEIMKAALKSAREALDNSETVVIFAEGQLSRHGNLNSFKTGLEKIMQGRSEPIVPMYLDQVWGSVFSFSENKFFWKKPGSLPYKVSLNIGEPLPAKSKAEEVKQKVSELAVDSFGKRENTDQAISRNILTLLKSNKKQIIFSQNQKQITSKDVINKYKSVKNLLINSEINNSQIAICAEQSVNLLAAILAVLQHGKTPVIFNPATTQLSNIFQKKNIKNLLTDLPDLKIENINTYDLNTLYSGKIFSYSKKTKPCSEKIIIYDSSSNHFQQLSNLNYNAAISALKQITNFDQENFIYSEIRNHALNQLIFSLFVPVEFAITALAKENLATSVSVKKGCLITDQIIDFDSYSKIILFNNLSDSAKVYSALSHPQVAGPIALNTPGYQAGEFNQTGRKASSYGHYMPNTACKIINSSGNEMPGGEIGKLSFKSYANLQQNTAEWLSTGITCKIDKDGFLFADI